MKLRIREDYELYFLRIELQLAIMFTLVFVLWTDRFGGWVWVDRTLLDNRSAVYAALATVHGALFGFVIAAVAIVLGYAESPRLSVIRSSRHYQTLWSVFGAGMRALGLATVLALVALIVDRDDAVNRVALCLCLFGTLLAAARVLRVLWVLENIIAIVTKPLNTDGTSAQ